MSGATTRKPAPARAGIWWRQEYQCSGNPCSRTTSGPAPASTQCSFTPFTTASACRHGSEGTGLTSVVVARLPMELVHQPMEDGRSHDPRGDEEDQTRVEGVEPGEELAAARRGRFHRTHAAQEHGRVQERVTPSEVLEVGVAPHARAE